ncbi:type IV pilus assembly protein PilM [Patescibacteria group bacterium]|nr:type IV pilus assembly protein PilM [Patescibacteria group bacterium]MBU4162300.1 type IV pilus assembly protein PilM [Patescibacteria group bacterium]
MKFNVLNLHPGTFGLDISDLSLKAVSLKKHRRHLRIESLKGILLPDGIIQGGEVKDIEKLADFIKKIVSKLRGLDTNQVIVSLPEEKSFIRLLRMPIMPAQEIKEAVRFEAENYIPFSIDKVYLDSQIVQSLDKDNSFVEVLIAALPRKTVDPYVSAIYEAGLIPVAMETESQATARALIKGSYIQKPVFIVDMGATSTNFSVYSGNSLRFTSFIPFSTNSLTTVLSKALKISPQEAYKAQLLYGFQKKGERSKRIFEALLPSITGFIEEINKHIDYYQTHSSQKVKDSADMDVKELIFCGGGARIKGLTGFMSEETGLKVQKGDPLTNLPLEEKLNKKISKDELLPFTTAIGLALRGYKIELYD